MPFVKDSSTPFGQRTLAAIMFSDVVNFSGLTGDKEDRTLASVQRDFKLMKALVAQSSGKLVKSTGDGLLVHFGSAVNAVACAQEIQIQLANAARDRPESQHLKHRIGIHLGDVFVTEDDVMGNGVNIAARLQCRAEPGGICISQTVFDVVKSKLTLEVTYLGPQELNHIRDSVPIYLLLPEATPLGTVTSPAIAKAAAERQPQLPPMKSTMENRSKPMTMEFPLKGRGVSESGHSARPRREADGPFCIGILGDFSGREGRGQVEPLSTRRAWPVDVDNFGDVFSKLGVRLRLPAYNRPGEQIEVALESFDQFHPDELLKRVAPLNRLLTLRASLLRPATATAAAAEVRALLSPAVPATAGTGTAPATQDSDAETISRLLGKAQSSPGVGAPGAASADSVEAIVRRLAGASGTSVKDMKSSAEMAALEMELTSQLRAVLQHPEFQALEAGWRGTKLLERDFGGGDNVKLFLFDVTKDELAADLAGDEEGTKSGLAKLLRDQEWGVVVGNFIFGPTEDDVGLLAKLTKLAASTDIGFLAGARAELAGCESFGRTPDPDDWNISLPDDVGKAWQALRRSPEAAHVALALPRFLLRQPYGKWSDAIESFPFEELGESFPHESYLWGNAVFACGHVMAGESSHGATQEITLPSGEIGGLPLHRFKQDGESVVKPCAEAWLTERAAGVLEGRGLTSLISVKGRDAVRIMRPVSIAQGAKALSLRRR